jgi:uncharacterized protein (TIGR03067 family)
MRLWFYRILIFGLCLLVMSRPTEAQADTDGPKLQGDWRVVSVFCDGSLSPVSKGYLKVLIYDNKIVFSSLSNSANSFTYRINASRNPKTLDTEWDIRPSGEVYVTKGIYEIEKGRLRICQGDPRPTGFETKPNDGRMLFVLEHDVADGPTPSVSAVAESREAIIRKIVAKLPNGWICDRGPTSVVLRRKEEPVIVNVFQRPITELAKNRETQEDLDRRHTVDIKYRITLRFAPKVDSARVQTMAAENHKLQLEIRRIWAASYSQIPYPSEYFAKTAEETATLGRYIRLHQSLHVLPDGYWGDVSVYVMPTCLGYASFLKEQDRAECERTTKQVVSLLNSYASEPENAAGKE